MPKSQIISSSDVLPSIEQHFRVLAGPGAGKTFWLSRHIRRVVTESQRLTSISSVACISYTNIAVAELRDRIGEAASQVETSSIHSFLYNQLVRPYLHLVLNESGQCEVNHALVDGHEEHRPNYPLYKEWLDTIEKRDAADRSDAFIYLKSLRWTRDNMGDWKLTAGQKRPPQYLPVKMLREYKKIFWKRGIIDHEDVLYFAYRILEENPDLCSFISARYPYVFIDEFQDTNDTQAQVVKWLAAEGTIVGVIGDAEQSVYKFQGAKPEEFSSFSLPNMLDLRIEGNRRSTNTIISLLNQIRTDGLQQKGTRGVVGQPIRLYVGQPLQALNASILALGGIRPVALLRTNAEVQQLRLPDTTPDKAILWIEFDKADSSRSALWEHIIAASVLASTVNLSMAVREMLNIVRLRNKRLMAPLNYDGIVTEMQRRGLALSLLEIFQDWETKFIDMTLLEVYVYLCTQLPTILPGLTMTSVRKGAFKDFAEVTAYKDLVSGAKLPEETRDIRTVHQSKGTEFKNVVVFFKDAERLMDALTPNTKSSEERRLDYVALSRAEDRLFLSVSILTQSEEKTLTDYQIEVVRC
ncbi:MAG: ATP-dependent helicase [Capsulimonas sp.]|uniref:ATP-dependent helicase n=1 Tax=Capsulimonas sp. TaxID=2494211 RepID=UPI003266A6B3